VTGDVKSSDGTTVLTAGTDGTDATFIGNVTITGTAPTAVDSLGNAGDIRYDSGHIYVCVSPNEWKKAQLATWS
jgi:hypothetical protein